MRQKGSITVFLSLILVCVSALIFALLESARTAGVRYYLQTAADAATDSLYSNFHKELWENYRLILYEGADEERVAKDYLKYLRDYVDNSDIYNIDDPKAEVSELKRITDDSGFWFKKQLNEYMKYNTEDLSSSADTLLNIKNDIEQANIMQNITLRYADHSLKAVEAEKALMRITKSFNKISSSKTELLECIANRDSAGCLENLTIIENEVNSLDNKLKTYEEYVEKFNEELMLTQSEVSSESKKLIPEGRDILEEGAADYTNYTLKDKERKSEIISKVESAKENTAKMNEKYEIIERINELDEDEDADEIEDNWEDLAASCSDINTPFIESAHGIVDESQEDKLESMMKFVSGDIISTVLPDGKSLSLGRTDKSFFPSETIDYMAANEAVSEDDILINEYCTRFFSDFTDDVDKEFAYELEYVYAGSDSDEDNLKATLTALLNLRAGLNYMHIINDDNKMAKINELAQTIVGTAGMPELVSLVRSLIISVWSMAESVADIRALLNKEKTEFFKNGEDWRLDLDSMMASGEGILPLTEEKTKGQDYETYIKYLLLTSDQRYKDYRMMDMIQNNISVKDAGFKMESMIHASTIKIHARSHRVFSNLSVGGKELISLAPFYDLNIEAVGAY